MRYQSVVTGHFATLANVLSTRTYPDPVIGQTNFGLNVHFDAASDINLAPDSPFSGNDRFRVITASSMFADSTRFDANVVRFEDARGKVRELRLTNTAPRDRHLFPAPIEIGHWFELIKTDGSKWFPDSPTTQVQIKDKDGLRLGLQGFLAKSTNPNDDSLSVWLEWLDAPNVVASGTDFDVAFEVASTPPGEVEMPLLGDFDGSGTLDVTDIDLLTAAVRSGDYDPSFDVNDDQVLDAEDRDEWVHRLRQTWFGDANLDGEFSSDDFVQVFQAGKYERGVEAGWAEGDWNGDGLFDSSDFVTAFQDGGYEMGPRPVAAAVPEPTGVLLLLLGLVARCDEDGPRRIASNARSACLDEIQVAQQERALAGA